jgi:hypothetical protein
MDPKARESKEGTAEIVSIVGCEQQAKAVLRLFALYRGRQLGEAADAYRLASTLRPRFISGMIKRMVGIELRRTKRRGLRLVSAVRLSGWLQDCDMPR